MMIIAVATWKVVRSSQERVEVRVSLVASCTAS